MHNRLSSQAGTAPSAPQAEHPFLEALRHIEYGSLVLITPQAVRHEFHGHLAGPAAHMTLKEWKVLNEAMARGETGFADTYSEGLWESDDLPGLLTFGLLNAPVLERFFYGNPWQSWLMRLRFRLLSNSLRNSRHNIASHYDLGNDFYALWLDKSMTYSCALFGDDENRSLEEAQQAKYQRILDNLHARPGGHVLDIGCGWGGFAEMAARKGLHVTAVTLSKEQADYAQQRLRQAGLDSLTTVLNMDYRELTGHFDHVVSIGMFEHVGERYWHEYFEVVRDRLKPGGTAMIQSITIRDDLFETLHGKVGFIEQVIFPGGMLPSPSRFCEEAAISGLECLAVFSFGQDYMRTLSHWLQRFNAQETQVRAMGYDESFIRLWRFYLSGCIAAFASGRTNVMQAKIGHRRGSPGAA